jgi:GntR family transcriptional repressor for pyruvate dehydrogenase complex
MLGNDNNNTLEERIVELIIGRLESGERFPPEKKLAADFGVSRAALREVLSAFEASGIVVALQGSGRYAQMPDVSATITDGWTISLRAKPALLLELLDIRSVLELGFLPQAIERLDLRSQQLMSDLVKRMKMKAEKGEDFVNEDQEFHQLLFSGAKNTLLEQLLRAFWDLYEQTVVNKQHTDLMQVAILHEQILESVIRKNTEQVTQMMKEQFADARYHYQKSL